MRFFTLVFAVNLIAQQVSAQPAITSFTPTSGPVGTTVTITGTNFSTNPADNIVYFGATKATVTTASATSLTVTVPGGATYEPITVTTNNLTGYSAAPFIVTFTGGGSFGAQAFYETGDYPRFVSTGDLDGDGKADMVIANQWAGTISVFRNTGNAGLISFANKVDYGTGGDPFCISIDDLDGDGKRDLSIVNYSSNTISIFRNTSIPGSISFGAKSDYTTGTYPRSISVADIDGDGRPDLAVANSESNTVSIFRNTSSLGAIAFAAKNDYSTGTYAISVAAGDLDADSKPDLIVANYFSNTISVFRNTGTPGNISFAAKTGHATGLQPYSVAVGDFDGDNSPDVAVLNVNDYDVSILRNTTVGGSISFAARVDFTTGIEPIGVTIADLDGDGKPDMAIANLSSKTFSILHNNSVEGIVSFAEKTDYIIASDPQSIAACDFDGDGKPDIAVLNSGSGTAFNKVLVTRNTIAPVISAVTDITSSQALVHWYPFANAVSYLVRKYPLATSGYSYYPPVTDTSRKINNMAANSVYSVEVKAVLDNNDTTDWSAPFSFTTANTCNTPYNLQVKDIIDTAALLSWYPPLTPVSGFQLRYKVSGTSNWIIKVKAAAARKIILTRLKPATMYKWQMRSICTSNDITNWIDGPGFTTTTPVVASLNEAAISSNNIRLNSSLQIIPNPSKGNFTIHMQLPAKDALTTLALYNSLGERVWQLQAGMLSGAVTKSITLDNKLSSGMYILRIERNDVQLMQKVLVTK